MSDFDIKQRAKDWVDAWMRAPYKDGGLPETSHLEEEDLERLLTRCRDTTVKAQRALSAEVARKALSNEWSEDLGSRAAEPVADIIREGGLHEMLAAAAIRARVKE